MSEHMRTTTQVVRESAGEDGSLRIIAATGGRKADGLNLSMDRADLTRFESNPLVLYGHQHGGRENLPIGRADKTWIEGDELRMDITFDKGDPFAAEVDRKFREGYLNAFSVGFDAYDIDESGVPARWELHEVSAVTVPMDPSATVARDLSQDAEIVAAARSIVERAEADEQDGEPDAAGEPEASDDDGDSERSLEVAVENLRRRVNLLETIT